MIFEWHAGNYQLINLSKKSEGKNLVVENLVARASPSKDSIVIRIRKNLSGKWIIRKSYSKFL